MSQNLQNGSLAAPADMHSQEFYFEDGDVVLLVDGVLYRLHSGILRMRMDIFRSLDIRAKTLPEQGGAPDVLLEGMDDQHPIRPPQVTRMEWEHILKFIYTNLKAPPYNLDFLVAVLKVSSQWGMPESREWAIAQIDTFLDEEPVNLFFQFRLGKQYDVPRWVEDAVTVLIKIPLDTAEAWEAELLGFEAYRIIAGAREALRTQWVEAAFEGLELDVPSPLICPEHDACVQAWHEACMEFITSRVLHLESDLRLQPMHWMFTMNSKGMNRVCYSQAKSRLSDLFHPNIESTIVGAAMEELDKLSFDVVDLTAVAARATAE